MSKYSRRDFINHLSMGCASLGVTSMLNGITNMGLLNAAAAANRPLIRTQNNYKALVCILLSGGNDSYNMLVPRGNGEYAEYAAVRTNLALAQNDLLPINPLMNSSGKEYGLHPNLPNVQGLFESGKAAFIANIGALIEPTSLANYGTTASLPLGLYSHSDQRQHWQTSVPQSRDNIGWGGKLADILYTNNTNQDISMNISISGVNIFQRGNTIQEYAIEPGGTGSVSINGSDDTNFYQTLKRQTLDNILDVTYQNILETAYSGSVSDSKNNSIQFASAIQNGTPFTTTFGADSFSQRLEMVAKTIAAKDLLGVTNQTFFVEMGGFDNHDNFLADHSNLMIQFDTAIQAFNDALVELGLDSNVTTFTMSDFGRKLVSNGDGSDHGWGGHAMVMGGAVNGQRIYGQYPDLYLGNAVDAGNGRLIPTTSCDEYFAELALWFGASSSDLDQIFPNIGNFWTPTSGSMPLGFLS